MGVVWDWEESGDGLASGELMVSIPDYLTYFHRTGQVLFEVLSDLDEPVFQTHGGTRCGW